MTHTRGRSGRETVLRRLCLVAVVAPLTVIATSGLLRPEPAARNILSVPSAAAADPAIPDLPDLPDAVEEPASVSTEPRRDSAGLGVLTHPSQAAVEAVPGRALTAYQRAETVMRQADPGCHVTWQLIAAIGQVESNHGRFGGALMTADGVVHPAILGPRLTGQRLVLAHRRHRRRPARRRPALRPRGRPDAVHPVDLDGRGRGRRRRRPARPAGHRRRQPGHRRLPLQRHRRPGDQGRAARRRLPLQPQRDATSTW